MKVVVVSSGQGLLTYEQLEPGKTYRCHSPGYEPFDGAIIYVPRNRNRLLDNTVWTLYAKDKVYEMEAVNWAGGDYRWVEIEVEVTIKEKE